ncbi:MAG: D-2-hydroxyacid dehydrogenase [Flavobacteriales bacterium]|nr:D-2-hydroxyacid dehydrogenase [Flavobacteriales bacterium]
MKVLANDGISASGIAKLNEAGIEVITDKVAQDQLAQSINDEGYVGVLVRSATTVRKEVIDACPGLKFIGRGGVGMDNIDVDYARSKGIAVFNTPASSSQSVAELVMGHMFAAARGLFDSNRQMPSKGSTDFKQLKKKYAKGMELRGKTLGIIGFGRIGRSLASYALGCGMKVVAHDMYPSDAPVQLTIEGHGTIDIKVPHVSFDEAIQNSDFISLHVPKQADGSAVIGEKELSAMKSNAVLVNAARGGVIDEAALMTAMSNGEIRHAALDVFDNEPTPDAKLLEVEGVGLSPHIGAATVEAQDRIGLELADQILEVLGKTVA